MLLFSESHSSLSMFIISSNLVRLSKREHCLDLHSRLFLHWEAHYWMKLLKWPVLPARLHCRTIQGRKLHLFPLMSRAKVLTMAARHQQDKQDYTLVHPHRSAASRKSLNHVIYWKHGGEQRAHPQRLHQQGGCAWPRPLHHRYFCVCHRDSGHNWKCVSHICLLQVSLG